MNNALDCSTKTAKVPRRAMRPHHKIEAPKPLCVVGPDAAEIIVAKVKAIHRADGVGSYVFIDPAMNVYVISELKPMANAWVADRFKWLVGAYSTIRGKPIAGLTATVNGVSEDIAEHLADLGRVTA